MKQTGMVLRSAVFALLLFASADAAAAQQSVSMERFVESLTRIEGETMYPLLYGEPREIGDPREAIERWRSLSEEAARDYSPSWREEGIIARELERRENDFYRRLETRRTGTGTAFPAGPVSGEELLLLEERERELIGRRLDWERRSGETYRAGAEKARREYGLLLSSLEEWKSGELLQAAARKELYAGRLAAYGQELDRDRAAAGEERLAAAAAILDGMAALSSSMEEGRKIQFSMRERAAACTGQEREKLLEELDRFGAALDEQGEILDAYCAEVEKFCPGPLESERAASAERLFEARLLLEEFDGVTAAAAWGGGVPVDMSAHTAEKRKAVEELVRREELRFNLFGEIARRLSAAEEQDPEPGKEEAELCRLITDLEESRSLLEAERVFAALELERCGEELEVRLRGFWGEEAKEDGARGRALLEELAAGDLLAETLRLGALVSRSGAAGVAGGAGNASPDLAAHSAAFRALLEETGLNESDLLSGAAAGAAAELEASPLLGEGAGLLLRLAGPDCSGEVAAYLREAMTGALNRIILDAGNAALERKIDGCTSRITACSAQAATSAAVAAICYAGLNIPGGVAATALSVASALNARSWKEKRGDLEEIRRMTTAVTSVEGEGIERIRDELGALSALGARKTEAELRAAESLARDWTDGTDEAARAALEEAGAGLPGISTDERYRRAAASADAKRRAAAVFTGLSGDMIEQFLSLTEKAALSDDRVFEQLAAEGAALYRSTRLPGKLPGEALAGAGFSEELLSRAEKGLAEGLRDAQRGALLIDGYRLGLKNACAVMVTELEETAMRSALSWWEEKEAELVRGTAEWADTFAREADAGRREWYALEERFHREREEAAGRIFRGGFAAMGELMEGISCPGPVSPLFPAFSGYPVRSSGGWDPLAGGPGTAERFFGEETQRLEDRLEKLHAESVQAAGRLGGMVETGIRNSLMGRLQDREEELRSAVGKTNRTVRSDIESSLMKSGYALSGRIFSRQAVVDLWLGGYERKLQQIETYRDFQLPEFGWRGELAAIPAGAAECETLFRKVAFESSAVFSAAAGHVGRAPSGGNEGSGELGRIFTLHAGYEQELGRGLSMMETAFHDRRFWDDDSDNDGESDSFFRAPTVRSAADLGMQIAASALLGPGFGSMALGLADDLFFGMDDLSAGRSGAADVFGGIGRKAAVSFIGSGGAGSAGAAGWYQGGSMITDAGKAAASAALKQTIGSGVSAFTLSGDGIGFDRELFLSSAFSMEALAGIGSAAAVSAVSGAYGHARLTREASEGLNSVQLAGMESTGRLLSGAAGAAVSAALTGELELNLLNAADIGRAAGINLASCGLLELHLGGDAHAGFGSGGLDLSAGTVYRAAEGYGTLAMRRRILDYADAVSVAQPDGTGAILRPALMYQYGFGDERGREQLERLLSGEDLLRIGTWTGADGAAAPGETKRTGGGRTISVLAGGPRTSTSIGLASVLQHEAFRDGSRGPGNREETAAAVMAHTGLVRRAGMDALYGAGLLSQDPFILREQIAFAAADAGMLASRAYDSTGDYFRLTEEGELLFDGSHNLWSAGGALMADHDRGSFSQSLADHFGISRSDALALMEESGLVWDEPSNRYIDSVPGAGIRVPGEIAARGELLDRFGPGAVEVMNISGSSAYAWALRERSLRRLAGEYGPSRYERAMDEALAGSDAFYALTRAPGERVFTGIKETATLERYSQQSVERAVLGSGFPAGSGNGYCLAQSIAFAYADRYPGISMEETGRAFAGADFGASFDRNSGMVYDKKEFSKALGKALGVSAYITEERYASAADMNTALRGGDEDYFMVADYGSHFTHVRENGLEINSYAGWKKAGAEPEGWRLMTWHREE